MVYKPPLSPGPFENWLSSSSSPPSPPPAPRFVRSFVHPARGVTHHPSPPLSSSLLLEHGLLSRGYPRITGQPRNGFPSSPPLNGENRGKDASCVCARARVYVCVCVGGGDHRWRRSMKSRSSLGIGEFCHVFRGSIDRKEFQVFRVK